MHVKDSWASIWWIRDHNRKYQIITVIILTANMNWRTFLFVSLLFVCFNTKLYPFFDLTIHILCPCSDDLQSKYEKFGSETNFQVDIDYHLTPFSKAQRLRIDRYSGCLWSQNRYRIMPNTYQDLLMREKMCWLKSFSLRCHNYGKNTVILSPLILNSGYVGSVSAIRPPCQGSL